MPSSVKYIDGGKILAIRSLSEKIFTQKPYHDYAQKLWELIQYQKSGSKVEYLEWEKNHSMVLNSLICKAIEFNKKYIEQISLAQLKEVYFRGLAMCYKGGCKKMNPSSVHDLAMARVDLFLTMASGKQVSESYKQEDCDLIYCYNLENVDQFFVSDLVPKKVSDFDDTTICSLEQEGKLNATFLDEYMSSNYVFNMHDYISDLVAHLSVHENFNFFKFHEIKETPCKYVNYFSDLIRKSNFDPNLIKNILKGNIKYM